MSYRRLSALALFASSSALALGCGSSGNQNSGSGGSNAGGAGVGASTSNGGNGPGSSSRASAASSTGTSANGGGGGAGGAGGASSGGGGSASTPIKHVVVIVKENHTFDNYFGSFPGAEGTTTCQLDGRHDVRLPAAPPTTSRDLCHAHDCALADWNDGQMNGWENDPAANQNGDHLAWAQYDGTTSRTTGRTPSTSRSPITSSPTSSGRASPGTSFVLAAQAGWATGNPDTHDPQPYWGCDEPLDTRHRSSRTAPARPRTCSPASTSRASPTCCPPASTGSSTARTSTSSPRSGRCSTRSNGIRNGPGWANVVNVDRVHPRHPEPHAPDVSWLVDQDLDRRAPGHRPRLRRRELDRRLRQPDHAERVLEATPPSSSRWTTSAAGTTTSRRRASTAATPTTPYGLGFRLPLIVISPYAKPGFIFKEQSPSRRASRGSSRRSSARRALSTLDPAAQDGQANDS